MEERFKILIQAVEYYKNNHILGFKNGEQLMGFVSELKHLHMNSIHIINGFKEGGLIKRIELPKGNGSQLNKYTIGKTYKIEEIRYNYRGIKKACGIRSDDGYLRWLSYSNVIKEHEPITLSSKRE